MNDNLLIKNCRLYNSADDKLPFDILIENSKIKSISVSANTTTEINSIDAGGRVAAPGLIDVHIQGAGGADILDGTLGSLQAISKTLATVGTTLFLGTTVMQPLNKNRHLFFARDYVGKDLGGAQLFGFHIEGPFVNINKKGGLSESGIYSPSLKALEEIFDITKGTLRMMTIAPELPGNLEIIRRLVKNNVIASFAHSDANYEETLKGFEAGINHVTHIFNAMPPLHHRNPGALTAIFENDRITAQIISDGHHLHPVTIRLIFKTLGAGRCVLITDGMHGIGLPDGRYVYNGREYESKEGAARYTDGTLIGSSMSLANIVLKFREFTGCTFEDAINAASKVPAQLLNIYDKKGSLEPGKDADIIIFDNDYSIYATFISGNLIFSKR
jgi:N-acetylglucosamine-6-phosphate deacetylase